MTTTKGAICEPAPAKVNLTLHVTGRRADGYHLLDSLVMFTALGDVVTVAPADHLTLTIDGPFSADLIAGDNNLVERAARSFGVINGAAITLTKNLPIASGIGGGSADAAATLRALSRLWGMPIPDAATILKLGADVPVCMTSELSRMRGIGDRIDTLGPAPKHNILLVNPNVAVSTAQVFGGLANRLNAPMADDMPDPFETGHWTKWLACQRNDLETPARVAVPAIDDVLGSLRAQNGCALARMSGSGATCFAFFENANTRNAAAAALRRSHPSWWIAETEEAPI
ncbi:4-diphosphocytidyl-2C-methyl-D-erythritol 2-phosphate synthase IspE [Octadecabacter antarcticus 307]|uniref:4-diphosphocytidyl-2-C-methyl-D-erythritol kinase n=1 Tax=Octadecabacter antarcticus 307 TaxID=391626 RepID=M9R2F1_9RHOB|nr:4-(cytidine 5'-diphospho)-2-C-methyl-D-erythritol kinase [Octadecabacter antarcticus]AGI65933.1 4-diphosphocytidyl-2C-methyl-D-erythritol 2-phosphate synthase IspE [Octadecabacter antarcticus 307]